MPSTTRRIMSSVVGPNFSLTVRVWLFQLIVSPDLAVLAMASARYWL